MQPSPIPAPKVILEGPTGTGKTHSILTAVEAGLETAVLFTEPHGRSILNHIPCPKLHWMFIPPFAPGWDEMIKRADTMTKMSWGVLSKMTEDPSKSTYNSFWRAINAVARFKCDRCGTVLGDVTTWGTNRAFFLDSYSGINRMAMQMVTGESIAKTQPQWGAAMAAELALADKLATDTRCLFVLICHVERIVDEVVGGTYLLPLALGKKNAPELPKNFSDVILTKRLGDRFSWSTADTAAELKAMHVPISDKLEPSFVNLMNSWKAKGGIIEIPDTTASTNT